MTMKQIDFLAENSIPLSEPKNMVPSGRPGKRLVKAIIGRWATKDPEGVMLESEITVGTRGTPLPAFHQYRARLNQRQMFTLGQESNAAVNPISMLSRPGHIAAAKALDAACI